MFHYLQQALRWRAPNLLARLRIVDDNGVDYAKLASRCQTQNEFNRLHIELENIVTPLELAAIARRASTEGIPEPGRLWLKRIRKWMPDLFDTPQRFERRELSEHVVLYQYPKHRVRDKGMLLAFCGDARRLMMPVSLFLQAIDSRLWDVVVLKKCARNSYLRGLDDLSTDFPGLIDYIRTAVSPGEYRRVMTFGTSSGGFAAIWAAVLMDADRGIAIGGCPPTRLPTPIEEDRLAIRRRSAGPDGADLCFVYGGDCAQDHRSAVALLELFGGRLRAVPDINVHGVLGWLLKRGQLAEFLGEMLA